MTRFRFIVLFILLLIPTAATGEETELTPLHKAAAKGDADAIKERIAAGADVDTKDWGGWTPLYRAAVYGHVEAIKVLVAAGADMGARTKGGWTPLHAAAFHGNRAVKWFVALIKELVRAGADVGARTKNGRTPSDLTDKPEILEILNGKQ